MGLIGSVFYLHDALGAAQNLSYSSGECAVNIAQTVLSRITQCTHGDCYLQNLWDYLLGCWLDLQSNSLLVSPAKRKETLHALQSSDINSIYLIGWQSTAKLQRNN
jgi:uncharacterized lipoprotein YddW (UPF0748 family)